MGVTLERDDMEIRTGKYSAKEYDSQKYGRKVIRLDDDNGRTDIEIHAGNRIDDTRGCILVGSSQHGNVIWHSNSTLDKILRGLSTPEQIQVIVK